MGSNEGSVRPQVCEFTKETAGKAGEASRIGEDSDRRGVGKLVRSWREGKISSLGGRRSVRLLELAIVELQLRMERRGKEKEGKAHPRLQRPILHSWWAQHQHNPHEHDIYMLQGRNI